MHTNCQTCRGKCCELTVLPPGKYPNPDDVWWANLPAEHQAKMITAIEEYGVRRIGRVREPCIYLRDGRCVLYGEHMPEGCQNFPTGPIQEAICGLFWLSKADPSITQADLMAQMSITEDEAITWLAERGGE